MCPDRKVFLMFFAYLLLTSACLLYELLVTWKVATASLDDGLNYPRQDGALETFIWQRYVGPTRHHITRAETTDAKTNPDIPSTETSTFWTPNFPSDNKPDSPTD